MNRMCSRAIVPVLIVFLAANAALAGSEYVWSKVPSPSSRVILAFSTSNIYLVEYRGDWSGNIMHWDGTTWTEVYHEWLGPGGNMDIWAFDPSHIWASSALGSIYFSDGVGWGKQRDPGGTEYIARGVMRTLTDGWAVGWSGFIAHFDGAVWNLARDPYNTGGMNDVYAFDALNVWAVGEECVLLQTDSGGRDYAAWAINSLKEPLGLSGNVNLYTIDARGLGDVWIGGKGQGGAGDFSDGTLLRNIGGAWRYEHLDFCPTDILILGENDVLASSGEGVWHSDGSTWKPQNNGIMYTKGEGGADGSYPSLGEICPLGDGMLVMAGGDCIYLGTPATLVLDPSQLVAGEQFTMNLRVTKPIEAPFDFYLIAETANYGAFTISLDGRISPGISPLYGNVPGVGVMSIEIRPGAAIPADMAYQVVNLYAVATEAGRIPPVTSLAEIEANSQNLRGFSKKAMYVIRPGDTPVTPTSR
jgi:hypothetical protein